MSATTDTGKLGEATFKEAAVALSESRPSKKGLKGGKSKGATTTSTGALRGTTTKKLKTASSGVKLHSTLKRSGASSTTWSMVLEALKSLNERSGSSRVAIVKYLVKNFHVNPDARFLGVLRRTLKGKTEKGTLRQIGQSFKLAPQSTKAKSEKTPRLKTGAVKRSLSSATTKPRKSATPVKRSKKMSVTAKTSTKRTSKVVSKKGGISKKRNAATKSGPRVMAKTGPRKAGAGLGSKKKMSGASRMLAK